LGFEAWLVDFSSNMKSNNISYGAGEILEWNEKITNAINTYYFTFAIFVILGFLITFNSVKYFLHKKKNILNVVSLYALINLIYLIFFVNKDWQHYYLSVLIASSLLFIIKSKKINYIFAERRDGDSFSLVTSNENAGKILGWKPKFNLESILRDANSELIANS
jgi:hypothetical protein